MLDKTCSNHIICQWSNKSNLKNWRSDVNVMTDVIWKIKGVTKKPCSCYQIFLKGKRRTKIKGECKTNINVNTKVKQVDIERIQKCLQFVQNKRRNEVYILYVNGVCNILEHHQRKMCVQQHTMKEGCLVEKKNKDFSKHLTARAKFLQKSKFSHCHENSA